MPGGRAQDDLAEAQVDPGQDLVEPLCGTKDPTKTHLPLHPDPTYSLVSTLKED